MEREKKAPKKQPKKEEPPLKFDTTDRIREQLAQEQRALTQTREKQEAQKQFAPPAALPSPDAGYVDKIRTRIKANIVLPPEIKGNPEAIFDVVQLPTGEVLIRAPEEIERPRGLRPGGRAGDPEELALAQARAARSVHARAAAEIQAAGVKGGR